MFSLITLVGRMFYFTIAATIRQFLYLSNMGNENVEKTLLLILFIIALFLKGMGEGSVSTSKETQRISFTKISWFNVI
jgi:hypothetical protein